MPTRLSRPLLRNLRSEASPELDAAEQRRAGISRSCSGRAVAVRVRRACRRSRSLVHCGPCPRSAAFHRLDQSPETHLRVPQSAVTTLAIVTVLVWVAALFIPAGRYELDADGSPIPGTFSTGPVAAESFGEKVQQLILRPVNGIYGLLNPETGIRRHRDVRAHVRPDRRHRLHHVDRGVHLGQSSPPAASRSPSPRWPTGCADQGLAADRGRHGAVLAARLDDGLLGGDTRVLRAVHPADGRARLRPAGHRVDDHPRRPDRRHGMRR